MKTLFAGALLLLTTLSSVVAQRSVDARDIIDRINRKEAVTYQNVTINGDLDLTSLANRREVREGNGTPTYLSTVDVPLTFRNCTFRGKVLAYRVEDEEKGRIFNRNSVVYNANFTEAVTMEHCMFQNDAAFKYSVFAERALFTDNTFREEALFKYSRFRDVADFSGSTFDNYADFKYTKFNESSSFQQTAFRTADFKYTKFDDVTNFGSARFSKYADFKYTNFPRGTRFDNARFDGTTDFKYTTLAGRRFAPGDR